MKKYEFYVYIIKCSDDSYYTGITNNLDKRISEHQNGIDSKCYTYKRRPLKIVLVEQFNDVREAIGREKQIKGWSRKKKEALIDGNWEKLKHLSVRYTPDKIRD